MSLTAIIPAAGTGTRLRPHTHSLPKALLPVGGRPVLAHILEQLVEVGVDRVVLVLGYLGDQIEAWVQEKYPDLGVEAVFQERRLGLGHAILMALEQAGLEDGPGLIVLGDTIVRADLSALLALPGHGMGVKAVGDPRRFGVAVLGGDRIVELEEKPENPRSNLALVGLYNFPDLAPLRRGLEEIVAREKRTRGEFQLTDALVWMIESGEQLTPFLIEDWFDVGKEETWLETNRALLADAAAPAARPGVVFHPPVWVPDDAVLADCELGPDVSLGEGVELRGCRIENSIVGEGSVMADCRLRDSLIGAHSRLSGLDGCFNLGEHCLATGGNPNDTPQR